ncbi:MAG: transcription-repair coupling factor [Candidatus Scalindua sp. AMX11]|nr:MAG: transcription-repair coupling factor [Candidatus Scalindua sp.]NOG83527.1 transcription-repair coupling factor [Planctomycetota bacterium]RZV72067.1 MAG: transcription-repair coupling factor [Candidatus Scalindua sp. SCAELEC01]TDE64382.1 MAG: transcription-repair coupling factor [Candidatus Scalindua sp. AMX11]GJQ59871.1 MAG: transcription-repair-coupling factor [Candidatus Scalindua sp.]
MKRLFRALEKNLTYQSIVNDLRAGKECHIQGLWGASAAFLISSLTHNTKTIKRRTVLLVTPKIEDAEELFEDCSTFFPGGVLYFPVSDEILLDESPADIETSVRQANILHKILRHNGTKESLNQIIVTPVQALFQQIPSPTILEENILIIKTGQEHKQELLALWLVKGGFERTRMVELPGEFSLRGGILDVFPHFSEMPYRIEFFGDEVDSIRTFHTDTQLTEKTVEECELLGVQTDTMNDISSEITDLSRGKDLAKAGDDGTVWGGGIQSGERVSLCAYLPEGSWIVLKEPRDIEDKIKSIHSNLRSQAKPASLETVMELYSGITKVYVSRLPFKQEDIHSFNIKVPDHFGKEVEGSLKQVNEIALAHDHTTIFCSNDAEEQRLCDLLSASDSFQETSCKGKNISQDRLSFDRITFHIGTLNHGFIFEDISLAFLSHHEIFSRYEQRRDPKKIVQTRAIDSFLDLEEGDYVVHAGYGIARFLGMQMLQDDAEPDSAGEFLVLEFDERAKVYVPVTKIELVQKYISGFDHIPKLSKLGKQTWSRKKQMAEFAVQDMASELLSLQAVRDAKQGITYPEDDEWQRKFESEFIFTETEDQLQVLDEIKRDMRSARPMDRLICGDVGYGKTEIAIRAAFKVVMYGKQVAVLVPTTLLAQQHYRTFSERMADYPIRIDMLCRFKTRKEQKNILGELENGRLDIVIGTHRLVQKDVIFRDIGLVVIDEEQRFGVQHKERLKRFRETVDVLTLTATPIPRTLHMSLIGARDISSLNTPPQTRQSIKTHLIRFDETVIRKVIVRELNRDGQIYFVHNRVKNIHAVATLIKKIVPEARISVGHGQMPERELEKIMVEFINGKSDILVSTTIIESGLDIPNVNTIFINRADAFGLADLHQLRGRVGRYKHRAYTYLILPQNRPITPEAEKRLKAIVDFSELGAGFKIAMRDLEIRGAGNIIGVQQHGHIEAVGYEMFCHLLEIAIRKAKNESVSVYSDVHIHLHLEAYIPVSYISDLKLKIEIYRKINRLSSRKEVVALERELNDRFGRIPKLVKNLLTESVIRIGAQKYHIRSLKKFNGALIFFVENMKKAESLFSHSQREVKILDKNELYLSLPRKGMSPEEIAEFVKEILNP